MSDMGVQPVAEAAPEGAGLDAVAARGKHVHRAVEDV